MTEIQLSDGVITEIQKLEAAKQPATVQRDQAQAFIGRVDVQITGMLRGLVYGQGENPDENWQLDLSGERPVLRLTEATEPGEAEAPHLHLLEQDHEHETDETPTSGEPSPADGGESPS